MKKVFIILMALLSQEIARLDHNPAFKRRVSATRNLTGDESLLG